MTFPAYPGERRDPSRPQRVMEYDMEIQSASEPGKVYRIGRDCDGAMFHRPVCRTWRYGSSNCRHHQQAQLLTERPLEALMGELADHAALALPLCAGQEIDDRQLLGWAGALRHRVEKAMRDSNECEHWKAEQNRIASEDPEERLRRTLAKYAIPLTSGP